ncbi:SurA N-terminal domain-containing protein [Gammaproteobacteria bacterium]|nr:SurA N-terminal domain-containing protein [Gammaproteobacteria bacterium]
MLESLRNFLTGPRLFIVIAACTLPFVFLGSTSLLNQTSTSLGSVNGETVTESDFQVASNITIQRFKSMYGEDFDFSMLDEDIQLSQIKNELIVQKSLLSQARSLGLINETTREFAKKQIMTNPVFQIDGQFDENIYEAQVNASGHTKESYIKLTTDLVATELFRNSITSEPFSTQDEVMQIANLLEQTLNIDFIKIDSESLQSNIANTKDELEEFYSENEYMFYSDEQRKFEYILLTPEDYKSKVVVPDNYINDSYDDYLSKAGERNQIRISHIMIDKINYDNDGAAFNAIQEIESQLLGGAGFSELASKYSDDLASKENGGDLEYFSPDFFEVKFAEAVKDLRLNDISEIVELDTAFHIIKVTEYEEAEVLSFEDMKDSISSNLVDSEALALMKDDYDIAYDLIDSNSSIGAISNALSANILESDFLALNNFISENFDSRVRDYIFSPDTQENVPFAIDLEESILVVSLKEINKSSLKDLESVSLDANRMLSSKKGKEKQLMLTAEIELSKPDGTSDDFISAYPYVTKDSFVNINRNSSLMPQEIIFQAFQQSEGDSITLVANNNDTYILDIVNVNKPSDESISDLLEEYKGFSKELISNKISEVVSSEVFDTANVKLNNIIFTNE